MAINELGSEPGTKVIRQDQTNEPQEGCALPLKAAAIEELWDWSVNFCGANPFNIFCDLIGYSAETYGELIFPYQYTSPDSILGYLEIKYLIAALETANKFGPTQVYEWIHDLESYHDAD